jgi:hypothetical protein
VTFHQGTRQQSFGTNAAPPKEERLVQEVTNTTMRADTIAELARKVNGYMKLIDENPTSDGQS